VISVVLKQLAIVGGLLVLLTYFLLQSQSLDPALIERVHQTLNAFVLYDAELDRDVLRACAGLLNHYDSLEQTSQDLAQIGETLRRQRVTVPVEVAKILDQRLDKLTAALQQKTALLEYFKSDNALLNNSMAYVIRTLHRLRSQAVKAGQEGLVAELGVLTNSLLRFMQKPKGRI
jgi:DAHL domain